MHRDSAAGAAFPTRRDMLALPVALAALAATSCVPVAVAAGEAGVVEIHHEFNTTIAGMTDDEIDRYNDEVRHPAEVALAAMIPTTVQAMAMQFLVSTCFGGVDPEERFFINARQIAGVDLSGFDVWGDRRADPADPEAWA